MDEALMIILFICIATAYALLCRWIGDYANKKGYSYWMFALFSFFISPLWGGLIAALLPERAPERRLPLRREL